MFSRIIGRINRDVIGRIRLPARTRVVSPTKTTTSTTTTTTTATYTTTTSTTEISTSTTSTSPFLDPYDDYDDYDNDTVVCVDVYDEAITNNILMRILLQRDWRDRLYRFLKTIEDL